MGSFDISYPKTFSNEGGFVLTNRSTDLGGETFAGISRNNWPAWPGWGYIDRGDMETVKGLVKSFYHDNFWIALMLDNIMSQDLADKLFDTAVNCGKGEAAKIVQEAMNLLGATLSVDGALGYATVAAVNTYRDQGLLLKVCKGLQFLWYYNIIKNRPDQKVNFHSWAERI